MRLMKSFLSMVIISSVLAAMPVLGADLADGYALLIQQSPPDAGFVTPNDGVHKTSIGEMVTLSAVPKPGYRFMYWLGDVKNSSALDTTISVDSPKMVVAVFAREEHEDALPGLGIIDGVEGGGAGRFAPSPVQAAGSVSPASGGGGGGYTYDYPDYPDIPTEPEDDDVPVPNEVPEPVTALILGLGSLFAIRKK